MNPYTFAAALAIINYYRTHRDNYTNPTYLNVYPSITKKLTVSLDIQSCIIIVYYDLYIIKISGAIGKYLYTG